jgi:hypothetical protein
MSMPSGIRLSSSDLLLRILTDVRQAVRKDLEEGRLSSLYLVGSAVLQPPPLVWMQGTPVVTSDLDLLLFVRENTTLCERRVIRVAIEAARSGWGAYRSIHIGCRFRPTSAVWRAVAEYASWGVNMEHGVIRLCGAPLIEALPREERARWASPSRGLLFENTLSKLWFIIYSLPNHDLRGDLVGVQAFDLRRRLASAAKRFATLSARAWSWRYGKPFDPERSVRWRSHLLRTSMEALAMMAVPERAALDRFERATALESATLAVREIVALLGASDCNSWAHQGWSSTVTGIGRHLAAANPDLASLSREAANVLQGGDRCHALGSKNLEGIWPGLVPKLHRAQFSILSKNLVSYS